MSKYLSDLSVLQWKSVGDIPDFPFSNYDDLVNAVNSNKYLLKLPDHMNTLNHVKCERAPKAEHM